MGDSLKLTRDEALILDAFFRRWQLPESGSPFASTLTVVDEVERFCLMNLSADIEGLAMDDLLGEEYEERLKAARGRLRVKHDLSES